MPRRGKTPVFPRGQPAKMAFLKRSLSSTDAHLSAPKSRRRAELFSDCQGGRSTFWTSVCPHGCPETPAATVFPRFSRIGGLRSVHQSSLVAWNAPRAPGAGQGADRG